MKKIIFSIFIISCFLSLVSKPAFADSACQPVYGGGPACPQVGNILINKTVLSPQTNTLVDNLGINDPKFKADNLVTFQITITNTGNATINKVQVKDVFPEFTLFNAGVGSFDTNTKILSFDLTDLKANETRTFNIVGKIVPLNQLPQDRGIVCVINQAIATADDKQSQDNAQFCIEKEVKAAQPTIPEQPTTKGGLKVFPTPLAQKTPPTGPEMLALFGLIPTGLLGQYIRKKTSL